MTQSWSNTGGNDCSDNTAQSGGTEGSAFNVDCNADIDMTVGYANTDHSVLDGTWVNDVTAGVAGISGTAYNFDGSDDYINIDNLIGLQDQQGTISFWANVDGSNEEILWSFQNSASAKGIEIKTRTETINFLGRRSGFINLII